MIGKLFAQPVEQIVQRIADNVGAHDAGLDLVDVEQRVEHAGHGVQSVIEPLDQLLRLLAFHGPSEQALNKGDSLERLAQIMAGRREKP